MADRFSKIPVVMAFTPDFLLPAVTCIQSILKSSQDIVNFHFFFLTSESLLERHRDILDRLLSKRAVITYIDLKNQLEPKRVSQRYTIAALYRLVLADLIVEYKKVMYVDCDVIIRNDLAELFESTDLTDHFIAGVFEATLPDQEDHVIAIGSRPGRYVNSGFLIMNLELLRQEAMAEKFISGLDDETLIFPDQDVINRFCFGKIIGLAPYWNSIRTFQLRQYKGVFLKYYSETDWSKVQRDGNVHYTGPKPWNQFTIGFDTWWKEYERLPGEIKDAFQTNFGLRMFGMIYSTKIGKVVVDGSRTVKRYLAHW